MDGVQVRLELSPEPRSVREARRLVRSALDDWGLDHLQDTAALLVSEVTTNAVLHARTALVVTAGVRDGVVRIAVSDGSPAGPARRRHGLQAGTGRGIGLVCELACEWGSDAAEPPYAKTVWFDLPLDPALLPDPAEGALLVQA